MRKKVVIAFSGGLDTSYCLKLLSKKHEVHTAIVNTGGFDEQEIKDIEDRAIKLGSKSHKTLDIVERFYQECIRYLIFGNILKNNTYPLSVSSERVFQAIAMIEYAKKINVDAIAHGSTGAGNDQIRFDLIFQSLAPQIEIITPIRDQNLSRDEEIQFLKNEGISINEKTSKYSINKGIWGTSIGGIETLTSHLNLPEKAWPTPIKKSTPQTITISFKDGEVFALNGTEDNPVNIINEITSKASLYGIGRDIHVGDTIIGIKGRVAFEAAAPLIIIKSHHLLEKHVLSKWQLHWKEQLGQWYGMMCHEGQYLDPVMRDIETFLTNSQKKVTGNVFVELKQNHFVLNGVESKFDLLQTDFGQYGEANKAWSGEDAKGFTTILSNAYKLMLSKE